MDAFIKEIVEDHHKPQLSLPPVFNTARKRRKKKRSKPLKFSSKILYDTSLRLKASSVLNSSPPLLFESTYKTSRLTQLSSNYVKNHHEQTLRSISHLSSINSMPRSQRLSCDNSKLLSSVKLPSLNKSVVCIEPSNDSLFLEGNRKEIRERSEYLKGIEENKKKVHKEIALGTDFYDEHSDYVGNFNESCRFMNDYL